MKNNNNNNNSIIPEKNSSIPISLHLASQSHTSSVSLGMGKAPEPGKAAGSPCLHPVSFATKKSE